MRRLMVLALILGAALAPRAARAREDAVVVVEPTLVSPLAEHGRVSQSLGAGTELRILPRREPWTIYMGGFYALGQPDGKKTLRDLMDVHFNVGFNLDDPHGKGIIPFASLGLDVLHMATRIPDGPTYRGTTLGVNARLGVMGFVGKRWFYTVSAAYLGAVVPGTGDDLGGLVMQAGLGMSFSASSPSSDY